MNRTEGLIMSSASRVAALLAAIFFLIATLAFWPFVADDAYIVGRYALNVAAGHGLVYNAGEYVSALTSPLHALIEAAFATAHLDPVNTYRIVSVVLPLLACGAVVASGLLDTPRMVVFLALGLCSPFLALWTVGGLETPLLTVLATLFTLIVVLAAKQGEFSDKQLILTGLLAGFLFLTRHDTVVVTAPVLVTVLFHGWRRPALWLGTAVMLVVVAGWLGFAALYYGNVLPTSFYLKMLLLSRPGIDSVAAIANFLVLSGVLILVPLYRRRRTSTWSPLARALVYGAIIAATLFFIYATRSAGQHMMYGYRMFVPWLPSMALIIALWIRLPNWTHGLSLIVFQSAVTAMVYFGGINPAPLNSLPIFNRAYAEYTRVTPKMHGELTELFRSDAAKIASHWSEEQRPEQPRVYLRSGGIGYWLPDFYVYESLVSYRNRCGLDHAAMIDASHYIQDLGFSLAYGFTTRQLAQRGDIALNSSHVTKSIHDWMGPTSSGFYYGPTPSLLVLPDTLDGSCTRVDRVAVAAKR